MAPIAPQLLHEYGTLARATLDGYLGIRAPRGAEYLSSALREYPGRAGRSLRATLCIAMARAFGASVDDALNSAVAIELLHNAFLVHDDIEDESEERRGKPTLHAMHGTPIAINVGDAMTVLSLRPLLANRSKLGARVALRILEEAERMARETVEGQAIELGWRHTNAIDLGEDDYLRMVLKKTCWYTTIFPSRVGALIGTRDAVDLERFLRFGFFVGAAFQIQDDVLNLLGDPSRYGKELWGDLWEGKRTLMIVHLLKSTNEAERAKLCTFLGKRRERKAASEVSWVRRLMDRYDSIDYARRVAHGLAGAASLEFERNFNTLPESRDLRFVRELPTWVIHRA
jgi:geranylgeranyl diphosphate synthase, type II